MNQQVIDRVTNVFFNTNFANQFALPGLFKIQATVFELKTERFAKWFNSLGLPLVDNVWINCVNATRDQEEIYSYLDFLAAGSYGDFIARSIAIPGMIDKGPYLDGGVSENPCLSQWREDNLPIFVSQLMMPHRRVPKNRIEKLFYSWEFKAFASYQDFKAQFGNRITTLYPMIDDIDSADFALPKGKKVEMIQRAYRETLEQLRFFGLVPSSQPLPIALALSGGGIRSGAHIGVVQALMEYGLHPVKWSGTSGGSAFAVLFAGYEKMLNKAA
jgi:predicted acylesterase/phospholipase RssA